MAKRCSRATALSSALRKFERSRGPKALGPDVACPVERRWSIRLRVANAMPIELSLNRFPCGAITSAPDLTHRLASFHVRLELASSLNLDVMFVPENHGVPLPLQQAPNSTPTVRPVYESQFKCIEGLVQFQMNCPRWHYSLT